MSILETILSPIIWLMELILNFYIHLTSSIGISILLLSFSFALFLLPIQKLANRVEKNISDKVNKVDKEVNSLRTELKGEKLFLATEKIYKKYNYHPIHSIGMGASFLAMLPVLLSAILLFNGSEMLTGKSFLIIEDLSKPDGFYGVINILPIIMTGITFIDAKLRFSGDRRSQNRFYIIALVLLVIVYSLPSGLVLYWLGSNVMALTLNRIQSILNIE